MTQQVLCPLLLRGLNKPAKRQHGLTRAAVTAFVHKPQTIGCRCRMLRCGALKPIAGALAVTRAATAIQVGLGQQELCKRSTSCRLKDMVSM